MARSLRPYFDFLLSKNHIFRLVAAQIRHTFQGIRYHFRGSPFRFPAGGSTPALRAFLSRVCASHLSSFRCSGWCDRLAGAPGRGAARARRAGAGARGARRQVRRARVDHRAAPRHQRRQAGCGALHDLRSDRRDLNQPATKNTTKSSTNPRQNLGPTKRKSMKGLLNGRQHVRHVLAFQSEKSNCQLTN